MGSKGKKAAARQARLSHRKKKGRKERRAVPSPESQRSQELTDAPKEATPGSVTTPTTAPSPKPPVPSPSAPKSTPLPSYPYVWSELRRIGIISGVILALLGVLALLLR